MWRFKNLEPVSAGKVKETPLREAQVLKILSYVEALAVANNSLVPNPLFSDYFVKGSIGIVGGRFLPAGNIEYGVMQALHCEECAVAAFRAHYGWDVKGEIVFGFASSKKEINTPPTCCGNCRDIMIDALGTDFEFVSGGLETEEAAISSMKSLLFNSPKRVELPADICGFNFRRDELQLLVHRVLENEKVLANDAYSPINVFPERHYSVAIVSSGDTYSGAIDGMCEYHPIYPMRDAVREARRHNFPSIKFVVVVHDEKLSVGPPHVMYKDRQHLLEMNLQWELLSCEEHDPPVLLVNHRNGVLTSVWQTSAKEWLPFPFTPRNFGKEFVEHLTSYYRSIPR